MREYQKSLSRFEIARLIAARAIQIAMGAPVFIKLSKEELVKINYDPTEIARMELEKKVLPLVVKRK
ncbi:MAG TPA: DNA-directed RNA polymerase subunit K [Candidatus Nanopusillus sp.]|nr:DNA-directed RNA polymerase subunit K [Candidatus Nanopusillus sp.]HIP90285.1 DNA-directed RNA polymerase subunit K [Candidatus Nanopusillus sp.]